jgi:cytochrome c-type biogenesis protein CcmE
MARGTFTDAPFVGKDFQDMNLTSKAIVGTAVVIATVSYLAFLGAASSWQYYLTVDETVTDAASLHSKRIRVSGRVDQGSLTIGARRRQAEFDLAGARHKLHALCRCAVPDNLAEGIDVVVEGTLQQNTFHAHKVITRCASKYERTNSVAARNRLKENATPLDTNHSEI